MAEQTTKSNIPGPAPGATGATGPAPGAQQSTAEANADAAQQGPGGTKSSQDATVPKDPDAENSVGGPNPAQPAVASGIVGANTGRLPSEGVGWSPEPAQNTGEADSDGVGYTQAVQRLVDPGAGHPMAQALGVVANIPPGSRPMMVDPETGHGIQPPQQPEPEPPQNRGQDADAGQK